MIETYYYGNHTSEGVYIDLNVCSNLPSLYSLVDNLDSYNKMLLGMNEEGVVIGDKLTENDRYKILDIEFQVNNLREEIQNRKINDDGNKDITSEFFILFDFLPEHIKKELKIYIK